MAPKNPKFTMAAKNLHQQIQLFQENVKEQFQELESCERLLCIAWIHKLLHVFVSCLKDFTSILHEHRGFLFYINDGPQKHLIAEHLYVCSRSLELVNGILDGMEFVRSLNDYLLRVSKSETISCAQKLLLKMGHSISREKVSNDFLEARRYQSTEILEKLYRGRDFADFAWRQGRLWSATTEIFSLRTNLLVPSEAETSCTYGLADGFFMMGCLHFFTMWCLVAAIPCQDRSVKLFSLEHNMADYGWYNPIKSLFERIGAESRKEENMDCSGLLEEVCEIGKCHSKMMKLVGYSDLKEEKKAEFTQMIIELDPLLESLKGLQSFADDLKNVPGLIISFRREVQYWSNGILK